MATKVDPAVAKQRQQKRILIFGGVILAGLLAFQGPKLMKQLNGKSTSSSAAPAAATTPTTTTPTTGTTPTTTTPTTTTPAPTGSTSLPPVQTGVTGGPTAKVAGVVLRLAGSPSASKGQLYSFSSFKVKDPFAQQTKGSPGVSSGTTATTPSSPGTTGTGSATGPIATPTTASPVALAYATLMVNGKPQQLQLKQVFPKGQPTFVLVGVDKKSVKIGVAGGKFTGGGVVKLELGKPVTVMNTTTGQRFVMKLVFTGASPEQIAGFKPAASSGQTTSTSTQTTTASTQTTTASTP